jgi:hypothetical protein
MPSIPRTHRLDNDCPKCGGALRAVPTKSEPEEIRNDRICTVCQRLFMSTKAALVQIRRPRV